MVDLQQPSHFVNHCLAAYAKGMGERVVFFFFVIKIVALPLCRTQMRLCSMGSKRYEIICWVGVGSLLREHLSTIF